MLEKDIRPEHLMEMNKHLHQEDVRSLLLNKEQFVFTLCPACESTNYKLQFIKNNFNFVICNKCETLFINPRPTFEQLVNFYQSSKSIAHWEQIFNETENVRRSNIFIPRANQVAELCKKYNTKREILIDVGAGFGTFCEEIKKRNLFEQVIAIEPSSKLAKKCREKKIDTIEEPIEKVRVDKVSVITCFELIEHLFSPKNFITSCHSILSDNGLFILTTPNIRGFDLITLGALSNNIDGPNHINYFHPDSIKILFNNSGFDVLEILTPGKLDAELVRKKILNKEFDISNHPFLKQILIDKWNELGIIFQDFLCSNLLSSHMWVVAKKHNTE